VLFGFAFTWLFVFIGLVAGNAQAAQGMSLMVFPLTFVSSAYVPVDSLPGWLRPVAEHQPITYMVDAVRALCLGRPDGGALVGALVWSVVLVAVFAPLAVARFRRS
jgi:ABC-type multidrug transport system permease subunit